MSLPQLWGDCSAVTRGHVRLCTILSTGRLRYLQRYKCITQLIGDQIECIRPTVFYLVLICPWHIGHNWYYYLSTSTCWSFKRCFMHLPSSRIPTLRSQLLWWWQFCRITFTTITFQFWRKTVLSSDCCVWILSYCFGVVWSLQWRCSPRQTIFWVW